MGFDASTNQTYSIQTLPFAIRTAWLGWDWTRIADHSQMEASLVWVNNVWTCASGQSQVETQPTPNPSKPICLQPPLWKWTAYKRLFHESIGIPILDESRPDIAIFDTTWWLPDWWSGIYSSWCFCWLSWHLQHLQHLGADVRGQRLWMGNRLPLVGRRGHQTLGWRPNKTWSCVSLLLHQFIHSISSPRHSLASLSCLMGSSAASRTFPCRTVIWYRDIGLDIAAMFDNLQVWLYSMSMTIYRLNFFHDAHLAGVRRLLLTVWRRDEAAYLGRITIPRWRPNALLLHLHNCSFLSKPMAANLSTSWNDAWIWTIDVHRENDSWIVQIQAVQYSVHWDWKAELQFSVRGPKPKAAKQMRSELSWEFTWGHHLTSAYLSLAPSLQSQFPTSSVHGHRYSYLDV